MTATTPAPATWPAPGLAWQLRTAASHSIDLPDLMETAARHLDPTDAQLHDVDELDAFVLNSDHPITHATLLDHRGHVHAAYPDHHVGRVLVVSLPSLTEALADPGDRTTPLARPSSDLEQCRFPMTIINAPAHRYAGLVDEAAPSTYPIG